MNSNIDGYIWLDLGKVRHRLARFRFKKRYFLLALMYSLISWTTFYICTWVKRTSWSRKRPNVGMPDISKSEEKAIDSLVTSWKIAPSNKSSRFCRKCSVPRTPTFLRLTWDALVCNHVTFITLDVCGKLSSWNIWRAFSTMLSLGRALWKIRIVTL